MKPFFRRAPVWLGFAVPVVVLGFQGLHAYFPGLPRIALSRSLPVFGGASLQLFIHFGAIGFFYLVNREIAFSLWVFSLLNTLQVGIFNISGWGGKMPAVSDWTYTHHHIAHQSVGAMVVLVLGGLWMARAHLRQVVRKAFTPAPEIDDSDEIIPYRGALFALAASVALIAGWLFLAGIPPLVISLFLFLVFVIFVALTRLCAEGGVATLFPPMVAPDVTVSILGSGAPGASGLTGLLFSRVWANDILNFSMPHCANGLKLGEQLGRKRGRLFAAMLAAALLAAATGTFSLIEICHAYGGLNLSRHFTWLPQAVCDYAVSLILRPSAPEAGGLDAYRNRRPGDGRPDGGPLALPVVAAASARFPGLLGVRQADHQRLHRLGDADPGQALRGTALALDSALLLHGNDTRAYGRVRPFLDRRRPRGNHGKPAAIAANSHGS